MEYFWFAASQPFSIRVHDCWTTYMGSVDIVISYGESFMKIV